MICSVMATHMRIVIIIILLSVGRGFLDPCNILRVDIDSIEGRYLLENFPDEPVIFIGDHDRNAALQDLGSKQNLMSNHGSTMVTLTSSNTYSDGLYQMSLFSYLESFNGNQSLQANESLYLFGNNYEGIFREMASSYVIPPCRHCDVAGARTVGLGDNHSGVSFHFHGPGFSEAIIGKKMWFLYPPEVKSPPGHHPNRTVAKWFTDVYPMVRNKMHSTTNIDGSGDLNPFNSGDEDFNSSQITNSSSSTFPQLYECTIEPGEMLYFPAMWMHATLNLDDYNLFVSLFLDPQLMK